MTLYLIQTVALAVTEEMLRGYAFRTYHHISAPHDEVQPERVLDILTGVPHRHIVDAHVLVHLLVIARQGGEVKAIYRVGGWAVAGRWPRREITGQRTLPCPFPVRSNKYPSVRLRDVIIVAISVGVHLQPVGQIVNVGAEKRELRQTAVVYAVVVQHIVEHTHVRQLVAQRIELHIVIRETLAIRSPPCLLHHAGVVVHHKLLTTVHHIVPDLEVDGIGRT